jgi:hypothetical protein
VLIDGDGQPLLGFVLSNHVLIEEAFDLTGLRQGWARRYRLSLLIVGDNLIANVDAFVADVDRGPGNELLNFILRFATE